jgi:hypothetical protein
VSGGDDTWTPISAPGPKTVLTAPKRDFRDTPEAGTPRVHLALVHEGVQNKGGSNGACRKYPEPSCVCFGLPLHLLPLLQNIVPPFLRGRDVIPNQRASCFDLFPQPVEARHQYGVHDYSHENEPGPLAHNDAPVWLFVGGGARSSRRKRKRAPEKGAVRDTTSPGLLVPYTVFPREIEEK